MRIEASNKNLRIIFSRRNLLTMIAKLDGNPPGSECTIVGGSEAPGIVFVAEEDDVHYTHREPGWMHPDTELALLNLDDLKEQ